MTTIRQIITSAYREGGIIQIGMTPDADQLAEGLDRLQATVRSLFGNELGDPLYDVQYGSNGLTRSDSRAYDVSSRIDASYVPSNVRLLVRSGQPKTIYLPPNPRDGARVAVVDGSGNFNTNNLTVDANGRKIAGAGSVVLDTDNEIKEWFYRADLGEWKEVSSFDVGDDSPFPLEFDDFLSIKLILRLNPRYLAKADEQTIMEYRRMRAQFRARYTQREEVPSELALARINPQNQYSFDLANENDRFSFGYIL